MSMRPFSYQRPATVDEAIGLLGSNGSTRPLAGGTDLLTLMKADLVSPERLIDIKRLDDLPASIAAAADGLVIGGGVTLADLEQHELVGQLYPALAEAAGSAATPQLRNMATVAGNLLQRPRCWYFRNARFDCWLKGGADCPARGGENQLHALFANGPCVAVHPSDLASALVALDASVQVRGPRGDREIAASEFFGQPKEDRRRETTLAEDELVLSLTVPPLADGARNTYLKAMDRKVWAFALVGVAVSLRMVNDRIADARVVLSGVAPIPWRCPDAERLLNGASPDEDLFGRAAQAALDGAAPLAHNGYKVPLAQGLIKQALTSATRDPVPAERFDNPEQT